MVCMKVTCDHKEQCDRKLCYWRSNVDEYPIQDVLCRYIEARVSLVPVTGLAKTNPNNVFAAGKKNR